MKPTVYLAGPITGMTYDQCTRWRVEAAIELERIGIRPLDPLRGKEFLASFHRRLDSKELQGVLTSDHAITMRDRHDVLMSDAILANLADVGIETGLDGREYPVASPGTMIEFGWANAWNKPIIAVMDRNCGNPHDRGLVRGVATYIVPTLGEAIALTALTLGVRP